MPIMKLESNHRCVRVAMMAGAFLGMVAAIEPAKADVFYSLTSTGTITSGTDYGLFGGIGNLAGIDYTMTQTFDATTSSFISQYADQSLNPGQGSTVVTVNGRSYAFGDSVPDGRDHLIEADYLNVFGYFYDELYSQNLNTTDANGNTVSALQSVESTVNNFMTSLDLSATFVYAPQSTDQTDANFSTALDGTNFDATINYIALNSEVVTSAPLPEPNSTLLLAGGVLGLGILRRPRGRTSYGNWTSSAIGQQSPLPYPGDRR